MIPALLLAALLSRPTDALLHDAEAVVVAIAGSSHVRRAPGGWLETVTTMRVEEARKGPLHEGETFDIVELGGVLDGVGFFAADAPRYIEGERSLILLTRTDRGDWTTLDFAAGKFPLDGDRIVRDASTPTINSYLLEVAGNDGILGLRWPTFPAPVVFFHHGTQPGATNGGVTSIERAVGAWTNDPRSNVTLQYGGVTSASSGLALPDGINSIQFDDPAGEIPGAFGGRGSTIALATGWFRADATHGYGGERFYTIYEADIVVQNGVNGRALAGNAMDHILTHELGHTLGLRHADEVLGDGGTFAMNAVMASTLDLDDDAIGATLQPWDREAIDAVYGATSDCTPPTIVAQPQSFDEAGTLTIAATGTAPLQVQWYEGARGNTARPIAGATTMSIDVHPSTTTRYWARVTNGCPPAADSGEGIVTVRGCPAVFVGAASKDTTLVAGRGAQLFVVATGGSGLRTQWFEGPSGDTSRPLTTGTFLNVEPRETTSYWARVTNDCAAFIDSEMIRVTVEPCAPPRFVYAPSDGDVIAGKPFAFFTVVDGTAPLAITNDVGRVTQTTSFLVRAANECGAIEAPVTLHVATSCVAPTITLPAQDVNVAPGDIAQLQVHARGTTLVYQWYEGETLDFTKPLGNAPLLTTAPIATARRYWVRVSNGCGIANGAAVTVQPVVGRRRVLR
ncbi:MAG: hypothetical protein JOZ54_25915 [Acidobacteria bacterium]|nr:hypothetical protein [Acidobacteriota bacterium]